ncbi:MAG TPA: phage terminase large subunit family protein [Aquabacterium sp.]|nr:phage terminase large subunit family protein [Aquabacterium sp.]
MTTTAWATEHRYLSAKAAAKQGKWKGHLTPWVQGIHEALDDPSITKVVCMKSAQVAWTDGVLLNYIGRRVHTDPCPMIVMFAKEGAAKEFEAEKFTPMVEATPVLGDILPITKSRDKNNRWAFKGFPGGFLKLVASNSPSSVKSTPAPVVAVEEPDDCNENVKGQGDTITLLEERTKSFPRRKVIYGGTPTIKGFSRVQQAYEASDQRKFWIPCPDCGEHQVLAWEHVHWTEDSENDHEVFGRVNFESVRYVCQHCGSMWTDAQKNQAVRLGQWRADVPFVGVAGFYINELYSPFAGSKMALLLQKYLTAMHALAQGDDTKIRSFRNNTEGLPYEYPSETPEAGDVKTRAEDYAERTVPRGGLILTAGVDVQHDRLAVVIRAWGRGEESWLVYWGELFGSTLVPGQGAWADLDKLLTSTFMHASGTELKISAVSIDGSDGNRTEIVHAYVRPRRHLRFMAVKGAAETTNDRREIFSTPRKADVGRRNKPAKHGLDTYIVGTARAKDLILETRLGLTGSGPGRIHWYSSVRPDYWDQLVSEVKAPSRINRMRKVWTKKAGVRNEALDCEVYALHAARSIKTHLLQEGHWAAIESKLRQRTLLGDEDELAPVEAEDVEPETTEAPAQVADAEVSSNQAETLPQPELSAAEAPARRVAPGAKPAKVKRRKARGGYSINSW